MPQLEDLTDLPHDAVELLEAVGYLDARDLADADLDELVSELLKANKALSIMTETPTEAMVKEWQGLALAKINPVHDDEPAEESEGLEDSEEETSSDPDDPDGDNAEDAEDTGAADDDESEGDEEANSSDEENDDEDGEENQGAQEDEPNSDTDPDLVNFEEDPEVQDMLSVSPEAIPLQPSLIRRHKLAVADIPEGLLLTQCKGEIEINVMTTDRMAKAQRREAELRRSGLMASRVRTFDDAKSENHYVKPLDKGKAKEVVSVSEGLNKGLTPTSRRFIRGVLHTEPWGVRVSAFFAVMVHVLLVVNLIGIPSLLIHEHISGSSMLWWVVALSSSLFIAAICYLIWGLSARCRVCGQRQFAPKKCLKNKKAHHIPIIGYIVPTALQALFFKWFYCIYCGTAVRLKK